ncbi:hypothetical protein [Streptomyces sp. IBSBF 2806]|uniref:hypothetical protein n=1 Tax=Streptomyces sp. IBSBF 2806 TaxID=2903529 RepID=UPI002FDC15C4
MTRPPGDSDRAGDSDGAEDRERGDSLCSPALVACARCGVQAAQPPPVTWTCSVERGVRHYFCEACARDNLRAIEGRLDSDWW